MQACLSRLYTETPFRRLFHLSPDAALEGYRLTEDERSAIRSTDARMLEAVASGLERKARKRFAAAYPLLAQLDRAEFDRLFGRFYQIARPNPYADRLEQAVWLGRFLEETLAGDPDAPRYASDLARYERLLVQARIASLRAERTPPDAAPASFLSRPRMAAGADLATFGCDMAALTQALRGGRPVPDSAWAYQPCARGERSYAVYLDPATGRPAWLALEPLTLFLLELCDGRRSVGDLASACEGRAPGGSLHLGDDVLYTVRHFQDLGVLTTSSTGDPASADPVGRADPVSESW